MSRMGERISEETCSVGQDLEGAIILVGERAFFCFRGSMSETKGVKSALLV